MKQCLLLFIFTASLMYVGAPSIAQTNDPTTKDAENSSTQQTDQSEEAWRKSKKKRTSTDPFDTFRNNSSTGAGPNLPLMRPIDMLPEESKRHLIKQRAKVIANMEFGNTPEAEEKNEKNAAYEPSEAAKKDPALAAEEEAVWEVIVTDLRGSNSGISTTAGGPHKVAVVGSGGSQPSSDMRGGSALSAAEIMASLKGLKPGTEGGVGSQPSDQGVGNDQAGEGQGNGQEEAENLQSGTEGTDTGTSGTNSQAQSSSQSEQAGEKNKNSSPQSLSPLSLPETASTSDDAECSQSSASAYIKHAQGSGNSCD